MKRRLPFSLFLIVFTLFLTIPPAGACTYFFIKAKDGAIVTGRTQEFYSMLDSRIDVVPRGTSFTSTAPAGAKALQWKNRFGFVGVSHYGKRCYSDGLNEKGLAAGALWFADVKYPEIKPGSEVTDIMDIVGWVLGNFSTVDEVKAALPSLNISAAYRNELKLVPPLHHYVTDAMGNSIVLEFIAGKLKIWDNSKIGVMTNEPDHGWHVENLRFYSNMKAFDVPIPDLKDEQWSLGTGLNGLPADYTSASRFARIAVLKYFADKPKNGDEAVNLALHLINTVDIPYGPQLWIVGQTGNVQFTPWIVVYDQAAKQFYYRTYENQNLRRIDLTKLDLSEKGPYRSLEIYGGKNSIDDTGRFR